MFGGKSLDREKESTKAVDSKTFSWAKFISRNQNPIIFKASFLFKQGFRPDLEA